ncbi:Glutathione import ATP-binding protein GsiA [Posidoniimonas polymericola]|uniref:Glutathione import ATP-binding protein GsiA n=1 Tax=Posidoniimonas polymericola TaxID=2528002 RepID=A0A5C5ZEI5_9BACT|nr:ABC transporter ATP-binding protein [Posidoniimonas polymericola]TWT85550.1 Glutathione import ATP-binding protein GsiA [Posidoniimonas polymericola]
MSAVIDIQNLRTYFHTDEGVVRAVDDVSFRVEPGRTLGIVGESGSGKSVTSLSIMKLLASSAQIESGKISFLGQDLVGLPEPEMRKIRGAEISMIFQEPMTSLNPVFTVGSQVAEAIILHQGLSKADARKRTIELFDEVGIPEPEVRVDSYPHQMSGGQKQRVMIAMALSCDPALLIADEPTTALDVTIQAQILDILRRLRDTRGMAILFITHDLGVIAEIADDVLVMYRGEMVEYGPVLQIFESPQHPYTKGLLACRPKLATPYRLLPTVQDFMETRVVGGQVTIIEKELSEERLNELKHHGRGRLLSPKSELEAIGHPWTEGHHPPDTTTVDEGTKPLLEVKDLQVYFPIRRGVLSRTVGYVKAVDGVSFNVYRGQTLGLVGESGCGKTTTGRAILRLIEPTGGRVLYDGVDMTGLSSSGLREMRRQMQIIFQDPYGSLNPRMTVGAAITEPMNIHKLGSGKADRRDRAATLLEEVGLSADHLRRYPHEFSGGQRQRICIARALAVEPEFIICDESVSALDVSVQAQVLNLLKKLQEDRGLTYIFISHDLSVVKFMADMMAVMMPVSDAEGNKGGKIVEFGPSENIYANPKEAYTQKLISATPKDDIEHVRALVAKREAQRAGAAT